MMIGHHSFLQCSAYHVIKYSLHNLLPVPRKAVHITVPMICGVWFLHHKPQCKQSLGVSTCLYETINTHFKLILKMTQNHSVKNWTQAKKHIMADCLVVASFNRSPINQLTIWSLTGDLQIIKARVMSKCATQSGQNNDFLWWINLCCIRHVRLKKGQLHIIEI